VKLGMSEILSKVEKTKGHKARVALLREEFSKPFAQVLAFAYDPRVVWELPDTDPPFTPLETGEAQGMLYTEARKLYLFVRGGSGSQIPKHKREHLFIQLLESIDPEDAKLVLAAKNKKIPYRGITQKLIEESYGTFSG
jgi:hypothetical protein|tara:strand:+ start:409 stop:825 length:417 start_codon:yes stop_codon:yes gene_type:complete